MVLKIGIIDGENTSQYTGSFSGSFSGSFHGSGITPNLQEVTTAGSITTNAITVGGITSSGNISASANIIANNITASNAFHAQAHSGFEFTISGSQFNMINETPDKNLFFKTSTGTGTINFGTDNVDSKVVIGTGGHITASANISGSGELYFSSSLDANTGYRTVVVDPATGKLYRTGSYAGGGGNGENYDLNATTATSTTTAANLNLTSTSGTDNSAVKLEAGPNIIIARNSANEIAISGSSITAFPFTGDAGITGSLSITGSAGSPAATHLTVFGSSSFSSTATFDKLKAERTILNGQVSIGNSTGDSIDFTSRVTSDFIPNGLNSERLGKDGNPWFGATITTITSSLVSLNESKSLSRKVNTLEIGNDSNWNGFTYGSSLQAGNQTHTFSGNVSISAGSSLTVSGDTSVTGNITGSNISGSGELYYSSSLNSDTNLKTVVVDTTTGKLFHTGSYSSGGNSGPSTGLSDATKIFVWYQGMT